MAVTAAYFNLQIPICLGSITTVLADIIKRETVVSMNEYFEFGDRLCFIANHFGQKEKQVFESGAHENLSDLIEATFKETFFSTFGKVELSFRCDL